MVEQELDEFISLVCTKNLAYSDMYKFLQKHTDNFNHEQCLNALASINKHCCDSLQRIYGDPTLKVPRWLDFDNLGSLIAMAIIDDLPEKELEPAIEILEEKIKVSTKNTSPKSAPPILAFKYKKTDKNQYSIQDTFDKLQEHKYIAKDTKYKDFKHAFSGTKVENPICWTSDASTLCYFIRLLKKHNTICFPHNKLWETVCACFVDKNGEAFIAKKLNDLKTPKRTSGTIEKIVDFMTVTP